MRVMEVAGGWGFEHLRQGERPDPRPGPGEVVLRMRAASINYRDFLMVQGGYGGRAGPLPLIPLSDGVGVVEAVGAGVTRVRPGDRVCPTFFQSWLSGPPSAERFSQPLGGPLPGTMQELMLLPAEGVVRAPEHMTDAQAASLNCAGLTAWSAVVAQADVKPGDVVLVQGTGGVSMFALQFAKMRGAGVIATSSSELKLEKARALGADWTIDYRQTPEWGKRARELTGGRGVDLVIEVGGAGTLRESVRAVRAGGIVALIGVLSGASTEFNLAHVVMQNVRLQGVTVGSREMFEDMVRAMSAHRTAPAVDERVFPWTNLREALEALPLGLHFGKTCLLF
jgi:NADPH:quinone reductase-like Zn-dependent oxidoreductase